MIRNVVVTDRNIEAFWFCLSHLVAIAFIRDKSAAIMIIPKATSSIKYSGRSL